MNNQQSLKLAELFTGTGAFSTAFHETGEVNTVFANDMLDSAEQIYNANFPLKLTKKDLHDIDPNEIPKMNILTAGFPCQPFSIAGMQKGFDDHRSNVFWKILSIMRTHKPECVILENVKNIQSHDNGKTFATIIDNLKKLNYHIKWKILNTCKITVLPQNRERMFIICFTDKKMCDNFDFDTMSHDTIENNKIIDYLETNVSPKFYYVPKNTIYEKLKNDVVKHVSTNTVYQYRRYYVRENKNNVCPTLTQNMGSGGHNVPIIMDDNGIRKLTPRDVSICKDFHMIMFYPQHCQMQNCIVWREMQFLFQL